MPSALETILAQYLPLTFAERDALQWLERRDRHYEAGEVVVHEGEALDSLYIVASGWLHGSVRIHDGGRQILRFYFVGDITTMIAGSRIARSIKIAAGAAYRTQFVFQFGSGDKLATRLGGQDGEWFHPVACRRRIKRSSGPAEALRTAELIAST
ncbi:cyclic nucleotide-binding domain-containing protein [Sphingomonas glaciei]|uniref:Cyclic nucleotide-binding domain-containing protein n=1 Tax=Sphingomonas glaciei TaxID=2938948 RepID=A0ABY5MXE5_9SPHN|nr:cyclic nucleotide-binding domain-containing protein [Sphingomonas glaciei]UUR08445.1 cyclic nucleotide-binding domain-containing protein [Sphingomonas glaciei]